MDNSAVTALIISAVVVGGIVWFICTAIKRGNENQSKAR